MPNHKSTEDLKQREARNKRERWDIWAEKEGCQITDYQKYRRTRYIILAMFMIYAAATLIWAFNSGRSDMLAEQAHKNCMQLAIDQLGMPMKKAALYCTTGVMP